MKCLSFDVGSKHLGICFLEVYDNATFHVLDWSVESVVPDTLNVNLTPVQTLAPLFYEYILKRPWPEIPDIVFIESQPMGLHGGARNLKTKVLSHLLQCHMMHIYPNVTVDFVSPSLKLKSMPRDMYGTRASYAQNKKYAVDLTRIHITSDKCLNKDYCIAQFDKPKVKGVKAIKKDDFGDCFLQGYLAGLLHVQHCVIQKLQEPLKISVAPLSVAPLSVAPLSVAPLSAETSSAETSSVPSSAPPASALVKKNKVVKKRKVLHDTEVLA